MRISNVIKNKIYQIYFRNKYRLKKMLSIDEVLSFNGFNISLPPGHLLPFYKKSFIQYDRFLPHLTKYLKSGDLVIDVGANCGDTLAAMVEANPMLEYVCIEPDDKFFTYLDANVKKIQKKFNQISIKTIKKLIGNSALSGYLDGTGGTKHLVVDLEGGIHTSTLDDALKDFNASRLALIKSDVDGYDYDVLDSAHFLTDNFSPILYFECHFDIFGQKERFIETINRLHRSGYKKWALFDNYGGYLLKTDNINQVVDLIEYAHIQNIGIGCRTIYYFDILSWQDNNNDLLDMVIDQYNQMFIREQLLSR